MQNVKLHFWGYTWDCFKWQIAHEKGVFLVYQGKLDQEGFVKLDKIIYIFYGKLIELVDNPIKAKIDQGLAPNEMLFYSYAEVADSTAKEIVSLLVGAVSPDYNEKAELVSDIIVESGGCCELLPPVIFG